MKYIKLFEKINKNKRPKIGDYVICTDFTFLPNEALFFIENNVGQIINIEIADNPYCVHFEKVPSDFKSLFPKERNKLSGKYENNCRWFTLKEILLCFKHKEDLEIYLATKKYNL